MVKGPATSPPDLGAPYPHAFIEICWFEDGGSYYPAHINLPYFLHVRETLCACYPSLGAIDGVKLLLLLVYISQSWPVNRTEVLLDPYGGILQVLYENYHLMQYREGYPASNIIIASDAALTTSTTPETDADIRDGAFAVGKRNVMGVTLNFEDVQAEIESESFLEDKLKLVQVFHRYHSHYWRGRGIF